MAFLSSTDYQSQIKDEIISTLINTNTAYRLDAESKAEAQLRSRLGVRYNVDAIFTATGTNRNFEIVMIYIDMAIYHLHSRISPGQVPQVRVDRYNEALNWLDKVAAGTYAPVLPKIADADADGVSDGGVVQYGSMTARNPYY